MDAHTFLDNFAAIAEAPGGIARLRSIVLELAVRGLLVAQDPSEEGAADLLRQISDEVLVEPSDLTAAIKDDEAPWTLPASWEWVRLKSIADFRSGKTPPTKNSDYWNAEAGIRWVTIADMVAGATIVDTERSVSERAATEVFRRAPSPPGTILMSFKLTIGKVSKLGMPAYYNEAIVSIKTPYEFTDEYLFRLLPMLAPLGEGKDAIKGRTLNKTSLTNMLIPLPPLGEQGRIVNRVDELALLCDELQFAQDQVQLTASRLAESLTAEGLTL